MAVIRWAIVDAKGELMGQEASINLSSSKDAFDKAQVPNGYRKVLLTQGNYDRLRNSYNKERGIYERATDLIESTVLDLKEERKAANELKAKPAVFDREVLMPDGSFEAQKIDRRTKEVLSRKAKANKR